MDIGGSFAATRENKNNHLSNQTEIFYSARTSPPQDKDILMTKSQRSGTSSLKSGKSTSNLNKVNEDQ